MVVPADCALVEGEAIINESMLTGESVPVNKEALTANLNEFSFSSSQKHILF